jgi:hypothetical protein
LSALAAAAAAGASVLGCALLWDRPIVDLATAMLRRLTPGRAPS